MERVGIQIIAPTSNSSLSSFLLVHFLLRVLYVSL